MKYTLGTRGSALALRQTEMVIECLAALFPEDEFVCEVLKTQGCKKQGTALAAKGDKRDWIHELELALVAGEIDIAVHSGKDVPVDLDPATQLFSVLERAFPGDVFIGKQRDGKVLTFADLQAGDIVGTASKRRQAQVLRAVVGVAVQDHRGNVPTRLQKLEDSDTLAGIILARAGLERLGLMQDWMEPLPEELMLPAVGQGTLAVQCRKDQVDLCEKVNALSDPLVQAQFDAERACIKLLEADCHSAVSSYARMVEAKELELCARVFSLDGRECVEAQVRGSIGEAVALGTKAGEEMVARGALCLLEDARKAGT